MFKLEEQETVIKILRRHFFVMVPIVFVTLLLALAPFCIYKFLGYESLYFFGQIDLIGSTVSIQSFISNWGIFIYAIWLLMLWMFLFIEWTDYYLDLWVLTNKRIIDVEQRGFFKREVTSFGYEYIQDITIETKGFIQTILKFATLHIQTAGNNREILIRDASNPEEARALILSLQHKCKANQWQNQP